MSVNYYSRDMTFSNFVFLLKYGFCNKSFRKAKEVVSQPMAKKNPICRQQFFAISTFSRVNKYHFCSSSSSLKNNGLKAGSIKLAHQFEAATQFKKHRQLFGLRNCGQTCSGRTIFFLLFYVFLRMTVNCNRQQTVN